MPIDPSEDQTEIEQSEAVSPGSLLRQARIDRGLDEKDIAERLHITVHYVKAIESDRYEKLPGIVFAKGYLKSYASAVGLDPDTVLQSFSLQQPRQQQEKTQLRSAGRKKSQNRGMQWAVASVACFTLVISVAWYLSDSPDSDQVRPEISATAGRGNAQERIQDTGQESVEERIQDSTAERAVDAPDEIMPSDAAPRNEPLQSEPDVTTGIQNAIAADSEVTEVPEQQEIADSIPETATAALDSEPEATSDRVADSGTAQVLDPEDEQPANNLSSPEDLADVNVLQGENGERIIAVDAHGEDVLRIRFSGESWVEINDGEDRQIYRDLREQGDILEVSGHAPFNILLGDAPYTSLNFNGADIDVTGDIRIDNSARLTVGL